MESNKQTTLAKKNYFAPGTYFYKFREQFSNHAIPFFIATTLLAPLERWRIIAQTQKAYPLRPKKFKSFFDYLSRVPKQQGITALWRSNTACFWIYLYQKIFQIGIYDSLKAINKDINEQTRDTVGMNPVLDNVLFPFNASMISLAIIQPLDTYRIHKAMTYHKDKNDALFTKFRQRISQVQSVRNLYKGYWLANIIAVINFNFYKNVSDVIGQIQIQGISPQIINKQHIISVLAVAFVHPLDTFKKIYQLNNMNKPSIFQNYRSVAKYLKQNNIRSALFNGFFASITRTILFAPIYWQLVKVWQQVKETPINF